MKKAFFALALVLLGTASVFATDNKIQDFIDDKYCDTLSKRS